MKTLLPERSLHINGRLNFIVQQILELAQDKIAMIILYGSFARGDWVHDLPNGYHSDTDILIILKKGKYKGHATLNLKDRIYTRLKRKGVIKDQIIPYDSRISIILESIEEVNRQLEKGRDFYTDIKKEGILLYDSGEYVLSEAKNLPWSEMKEIAQDYFDEWFRSGKYFLKASKNALEEEIFNISASLLHQDTESLYSAILYAHKNHGACPVDVVLPISFCYGDVCRLENKVTVLTDVNIIWCWLVNTDAKYLMMVVSNIFKAF